MTQWLMNRFVHEADDAGDPAVREKLGTLGSGVGVGVNLLLAAMKFLVGVITGSVAVTADAANNLSDAGGSIVSLISMRLASKPVDPEHPYGHGRMEYIGALGVGVLILLMAVELFKGGVASILHPEALAFGWVPFVILVVSMGMKFWLYTFYKRVGGKIDSSALLAAAKDSLSDVLATGAVAASMLIGHFTGIPVDGWMGLIVAFLVLKAGIDVCRDTIDSLLGGKPDPELGRQIIDLLMTYENVLGTHDLMIHDYGPGCCVASIHAEVPADGNILDIHEMIDRAEREIGEKLNVPICIHMDPVVTGDEETDRVKDAMVEVLKEIDERLMLHDFRRVPGEKQINLIFDVVVPAGYPRCDEVREKLRVAAVDIDLRHRCVIQFDVDYYH
ncbi:MAG: cation transporter [Clostridia bacterium]|nr:cation transporter [Clostridia bacterium]